MGMVKVTNSFLPGVKIIEKMLTSDYRGHYGEIYNKRDYFKAGVKISFVEEDYSFSRKNVLRGLHGDSKTWKLVSCLLGELLLVVLNYDQDSECFGKYESYTLTPENRLQVLIPPKYGNGHLVLSDWTIFHYKQSEYYQGQQEQFVVLWNDPRFNIKWPIKNPILSKRDGGLS